MSAISAATIKYGVPLVSKVGDLLFTVTNIEIPATEEEYVEGGIELKPTKLGLTDEAINGAAVVARESAVGEMATTTALAGAIWCNPLTLAKEANEEAKEVKEAFTADVTLVKGKPFLRVYAQVTAGAGKPLTEAKTATKVKLGLFTTTIFCLGK